MAWDVMSGVTKMAWDVMSGVTKTAWDDLSGVANLCGMFCQGCKKMAWDVLSRDVLSGSRLDVFMFKVPYGSLTCTLVQDIDFYCTNQGCRRVFESDPAQETIECRKIEDWEAPSR